jgi:hypothetical protein
MLGRVVVTVLVWMWITSMAILLGRRVPPTALG